MDGLLSPKPKLSVRMCYAKIQVKENNFFSSGLKDSKCILLLLNRRPQLAFISIHYLINKGGTTIKCLDMNSMWNIKYQVQVQTNERK